MKRKRKFSHFRILIQKFTIDILKAIVDLLIPKLNPRQNISRNASNFIPLFYLFYKLDKNDTIKPFFLSNSSSTTRRMFMLHTL